MKNISSKIIGLGVLFLLSSCKTYTIPVDSFRSQMISSQAEKDVEVNNPMSDFVYLRGLQNIKYTSNNIKQLMVLDKKGNKVLLKNSPSIEIRATHHNGKKYTFYFDTAFIQNDTLKGNRSRFLNGFTYQIPMDSIVKIEVQDGGKRFEYQ